jgi:LuxR family maltose regulon positive regulatory protein
MYYVEGKAEEAHHMIQTALSISAPRGYFHIFLDEGDLMRPLLESADARLKDRDLSVFVKGLLEALPGGSAKDTTNLVDEQLLSEREREVLRCLADGLTYPAIAERLIISVNTVRYHVKGIYGRLGVSSRAEAIARARETRLL